MQKITGTAGALLAIIAAYYLYQVLKPLPPINEDNLVNHDPKVPPLIYENITTNGIKLTVAKCGNPAAHKILIFLHGAPESGRTSWVHQLNYFCYKSDYFVIAPDQRGVNTSDKLPHISDYVLDNRVRDIVGLIKHFDKEAYIVGHDWGAAVAWWLAIKYTFYVKKIVVLNVPHPDAFTKHLHSSLSQLYKSWYIFFFQIPIFPELGLIRHNFHRIQYELTLEKNIFSRGELNSFVEAWRMPGCINGILNWYRSLAYEYFTLSETLKKNSSVKIPTLIIWGLRDKYIDPLGPQSLKYVTAKESRLIELPASHWIQHELPNEVNHAVNEFLP